MKAIRTFIFGNEQRGISPLHTRLYYRVYFFLWDVWIKRRLKCCNCKARAVWEYQPGSESPTDDFYCDSCVPRGCSCNYILKSNVEPIYDSNEMEANPAEDYEYMTDNDGRPLPCVEFKHLYWAPQNIEATTVSGKKVHFHCDLYFGRIDERDVKRALGYAQNYNGTYDGEPIVSWRKV